MTQTMQTVEKKVTTRKPVAAKAEPKSAMKSVANAVVKFFVFIEGARPVSGIRLSAHTDAALRFLGLAEMKPVKKNVVVAVMGTRAVKYHTGIGNMAERADKIVLTRRGYEFFKSRVEEGKIDGKLQAAYLAALSKGKVNSDVGIRPDHLVPVGMVF